jgi:hypothetical protein
VIISACLEHEHDLSRHRLAVIYVMGHFAIPLHKYFIVIKATDEIVYYKRRLLRWIEKRCADYLFGEACGKKI